MTITLTPQYPPPYNALVPPWLDISAVSPIACTGGAQTLTVTVYIHEDAPPGAVPILVTATTSEGGQCQATGTVTVDRTYPVVEIRYKTFIASEAFETGWNPYLYDYYSGDNRWFGYSANTSRAFQSYRITLDPSTQSGMIGFSEGFFQTSGYDNEAPGDVVSCTPTCPGFAFGGWCLAPTANAECQDTAVNGQDGNVLSGVVTNVSTTERHLTLKVVGYIPCVDAALHIKPAIDVNLVLAFRQICVGGVLQPVEYRVLSGYHDGFPWHEMYLKVEPSSTGTLVYQFDPCTVSGGPDPDRLFGSGDVYFLQQKPALANWQPVP